MKDDSLPYVYLDDDEDEVKNPKRKKSASKAVNSASRSKKDSLPYVYVDDDDAPRKSVRKPHPANGGGQSKTKRNSSKPASHDAKRKPAKKAKKKSSKAPIIISLIVLVLVAAGAVFLMDMNGIVHIGVWDKIKGGDNTVSPSVTATFSASWFTPDENSDNDGLDKSESGSISVSNKELNINTSLPDSWINILLLGTDSRVSYEASRTDTMMICSINKTTGQVKLTSIMRDTAVEINGRTVKLNSAYFYGGANLAMSTVNKYFGMNIDKYVVVNFSGFAKIVDALGGVDIDVADIELEYLNHNVAEQYYLMYTSGEMGYEEAQNKYYATKLESAGKGVHLDGNQALGYARIRKTDSDYERARRQRNVLNTLLIKMKGTSSETIIDLCYRYVNRDYLTTNLDVSTVINLATLVLSGEGIGGATEFRVPIQGSYKEETRNNISMLYDMNALENANALKRFIYEN